MVGMAVGCMVLTVVLFAAMPSKCSRPEQRFSQIRIEMVPGTTLKQTEAVADQVTAIVRRRPEVDR
jgi:multidrug efflux pump subunit AcrB